MKKKIRYITMLLLIFIMTGCSSSSSKDTYVEGTDYQYQYLSKTDSVSTMAHGNESDYFVIGRYLYQLDRKTEIVTPLCNKSNCLHDKETDENRLSDCNAYVPEGSEEIGIAYMDGYIYLVQQNWEEEDVCDALYKVAADGSSKEKVYEWEGEVVEGWCVHRNTFYYVEHKFDEKNQEYYGVKKLELGGFGKIKPKTIYEPDTNITVSAFGVPQAYGNHLYFNIIGAKTKDIDKITNKNWVKYNYAKTFQYNLQDESISEIRVPKQLDTEMVNDVTFWNDKIIYQAIDARKNHKYDVTADVYMADLDGTNPEVFMKDMPTYRWYSSDGMYLYVSDCPEVTDQIYNASDYQKNINNNVEVEHNFTVNIDVYDKNMKLVDKVQSCIKEFPTELPYGIGDRTYVLLENKSGNGVDIEYWDKSKLGTYKGKEYSFTKLLEQEYSVHDLQQKEEE